MAIVQIKGSNQKVRFPNDMIEDQMLTALRSQYPRTLSQNIGDALSKPESTISNRDVSLAENTKQKIANFLFDNKIVSDRYGAQRIGDNLSSLLGVLPGIGDAQAGDEFGRAVAEGDGLGIGIGALSALPIVGDIAAKGVKKLVDVTHGSSDIKFSGEIRKGGEGNLFDGLFGSYGDESEYGGIKQITYQVDPEKIMSMGDTDVDYEKAISFIKKEYPDADDEAIEQIYEVIAEDKNVFDMDENPFSNYGYDDLGEASWEGQRKRGALAKELGFDAVEMSDEFGTSVLIPYGSNAKIKQEAQELSNQFKR
jgi:hypothetical protein